MLSLPKSYRTIIQLFLLICIAILIIFFIHHSNEINNSFEEVTKPQKIESVQNIPKTVRDIIIKNASKCYVNRNFDEKLGLIKIDDILLSGRKPKISKTIFFHETTCSKTGVIKLSARQACAVESAASLNPNSEVFVLFASPVGRSNLSQSGIDFQILKALNSYKNIYYRNVNLWRYAENTPIQNWFANGILFTSKHIVEHVSDIFRLITLWRWGGTHLDFDILLKKPLEHIKSNYVGVESKYYISNAIISLNYFGIGHEIANSLLTVCQVDYKPHVFTSIGPLLYTKVFKILCKARRTYLMTLNRCSGFRVFHESAFCAVGHNKSKYFFDENHLKDTLKLTNKSIGIHVWNKETKNYVVKVGSKVLYAVYAAKYCPKVYSSCGDFF